MQPPDVDFRYRLPPELNIATSSYCLPRVEFSDISYAAIDKMLICDFTISVGGLQIESWMQFEMSQLEKFLASINAKKDSHLGLGSVNGELTIVFNYYGESDTLKLFHFVTISDYDRKVLLKSLRDLLGTKPDDIKASPIGHPGSFLIPTKFDEIPPM